MQTLWNETTGAVVSSELVLISALMVAGLVSSLTALRDALIGEIDDLATSISSLDQSFTGQGLRPDEVAMLQEFQCTVVLSSKVGR
jgi:hypothetical protein